VYGVDCQGEVPAADVMYVDEIDIAGRGDQVPVHLRRHLAPGETASMPPYAGDSGQNDSADRTAQPTATS
jgi:hypothetical protein